MQLHTDLEARHQVVRVRVLRVAGMPLIVVHTTGAMFVTNHVLAGAIAGSAFRDRPVAAFCTGVATHVLMDLTPHWGDASLDKDGFFEIAKRDGVLGLAALTLIAAAGIPPRRALVAGMLGAALLDADKPCEFLLGFNPWPRWLRRFHTWIQNESPDRMPAEFAAGVGLTTTAAAVLVRARARRAAVSCG
jgi:hypothetical protein